jgi:hypothetical protein
MSVPNKRNRMQLWIALCTLLACTTSLAATPTALPGRTTRNELYAALDSYLAALKVRDPTRVAWAATVRNSENNVELMIGDGLWGTITALGSYDLRFADVQTGQVGFFGNVTETHDTSAFTLRLQVADGKIAEVETLVVRDADSGIKFPNPTFQNKPVLNEILPPAERLPRARMISIADGYFDTLQLNDGTLFTQFDPNCNRVENGVQTTNNPELKLIPVAGLGCEAQFKLGHYRIDDRLRARRFPLVDEERGLVLAGAFIDHAGRLGKYKLTDGTEVESPVRRPHTFMLLELFKIRKGKIQQIEANFITVPYHMPSPWGGQ